MKAYPDYKDSGSEIIKAIPTHWDIAPLKFIGNIILGKMLTPQDKGGYVEKSYLRAKNIGWETVDDDDINTMWFSQYELEQYRLKQNDLLISEGGEVGRTAIWNSELDECYIQNSVHKVTINQGHNPRYYLYHSQVFGKTGYYDSIVNRVSIGHLTGEKLKDIRFVVPSFSEQQAIADFLDRKTAQIDALIEKKQRQIDLSTCTSSRVRM
jgi:type I restriction enzyme S subunit